MTAEKEDDIPIVSPKEGQISPSPPSAAQLGDCAATGCAAAERNTAAATQKLSSLKQLSFLDKFLALWIFLAMALGILLGYFVPSVKTSLQKGAFIGVSVPIAVGLLVMMYPILCKVRYETLHNLLALRALWIQLLFSVVMNWIVAPLLMLGLAWAFLPDDPSLREGLIIVGIARCIAMVLIWTSLANGDLPYCAMLVALNSLLQIILFAPFTMLYINTISHSSSHIQVSYSVVARSVAVFLGIPLGAAVITRLALLRAIGEEKYSVFLKWAGPWSLIGLLFTIVVLFASQSRSIVGQIVSVVRVAAPLLVYFVIIFFSTLFFCRFMGRTRKGNSAMGAGTDAGGERGDVELGNGAAETEGEKESRRKKEWSYGISVTQSLTAASNNFELAIAVAVAAYGVDSKQALAATVGPLIEVVVVLSSFPFSTPFLSLRKYTAWHNIFISLIFLFISFRFSFDSIKGDEKCVDAG